MLQSFWDFLRTRACDAVLAGVEDAVRFLEQDASPSDRVDAASQLAKRLQKVVTQRTEPDTARDPAGATSPKSPSPVASAPKSEPQAKSASDAPDSQPPPSLTASPAGHLQKPQKSPFSNRRTGKRGRPREAQA